MNEVELVRLHGGKFVQSFVIAAQKAGLSEKWTAISLNSMFHRGFMKDVDTHVRRLKMCQDRDNPIITKEFLGDMKASINEDGHYKYSGVGKTAGIETWAILAKYATDEVIEKFYDLLKNKDKSMRETKRILSEDYSFNFTDYEV